MMRDEVTAMKEITFIVTEDETDGGYTARAHWPDGNRDIFTEGDTRDELLANVRDALDASFDDDEPKPELIHLHFVRDEVIAR
jgi:predicted RNase H-like HicB family nuclease